MICRLAASLCALALPLAAAEPAKPAVPAKPTGTPVAAATPPPAATPAPPAAAPPSATTPVPAATPSSAGPRGPGVAGFCRSKRVHCFLALGKPGSADLLVPPLREGNESPALSYARAAQAYIAGNPTKAVQLLEDARTRFSQGVDNLFT